MTIASTALGLQASALSLPPIQPICFLITHPHSSMSPSCLLHPPLLFKSLHPPPLHPPFHPSTFLSISSSPYSCSSHLLPLLLICIPLLLLLSIYRHHILCNRLSFRFHQHLFSLVHHTHQAYASSSSFSIPLPSSSNVEHSSLNTFSTLRRISACK